MVATDAWQTQGFAEVAREYLQRLPREQGVSRQIDDNGDLLTRHVGKADIDRRELLSALATPSWLDPNISGPRL
jgi:hypothetical protein